MILHGLQLRFQNTRDAEYIEKQKCTVIVQEKGHDHDVMVSAVTVKVSIDKNIMNR